MNATVGKKNRHKMIRDQQQQQQPSVSGRIRMSLMGESLIFRS
jgi:hypothetical protein